MRSILLGTLIMFLCIPVFGEPVFTLSTDGMVQAKDGDNVLWETPLLIFSREDESGPVLINASLYITQQNYLFRLDPTTGIILEHAVFPESISSITQKGNALTIECKTRSYSGKPPKYEETFTWRPGDPRIPVFQTGSLVQAHMLKYCADQLVFHLFERSGQEEPFSFRDYYVTDHKEWTTLHISKVDDARKEELRQYIPILEECIKRHAANPWNTFRMAQVKFLLGSSEEAEALFTRVLTLVRDSITALNISVDAYGTGNREWSQKVYDLACRLRHTEGYVPRIPTSLIHLMMEMPLGDYVSLLILNKDFKEAEMLLERTYTVASSTEFAAYTYAAAADLFEEQGMPERAEIWDKRAHDAQPYVVFSGINPSIPQVLALTVMLGSMIAFGILFIVLIVKAAARYREMEKTSGTDTAWSRIRKFNPFSYATRMELAGFVLLLMVLIISVLMSTALVKSVVKAAGADFAAISGNPGHGRARAWYEEQEECNAKHILLGLHYHVRGEYDKAVEEYRKCENSVSALNNLGAALKLAGKEEEANKVWQQAAEGTFAYAAQYNLTGKPAEFWGSYAAKYFPGEPLLTAPSADEWHEMLGADSVFGNVFKNILSISLIMMSGSDEGGVDPVVLFIWLILIITVVGVGLSWRTFIEPPDLPVNDTKGWQWWMGLVIPGSARQWLCFGGIICMILLCSVVISNKDMPGASLSIMDSIAMPSRIDDAFGIGYSIVEVSGFRTFVAKTSRSYPWIIILLNVVLMLIVRFTAKGPDRTCCESAENIAPEPAASSGEPDKPSEGTDT